MLAYKIRSLISCSTGSSRQQGHRPTSTNVSDLTIDLQCPRSIRKSQTPKNILQRRARARTLGCSHLERISSQTPCFIPSQGCSSVESCTVDGPNTSYQSKLSRQISTSRHDIPSWYVITIQLAGSSSYGPKQRSLLKKEWHVSSLTVEYVRDLFSKPDGRTDTILLPW